MSKIRILTSYTPHPVWVDTTTKKIWIDFYSIEVCLGEVTQTEEDGEPHTWMFSRTEENINYAAPEERWTLDDWLDDIESKIDDEVSDMALDWFT